MVFQRRLFLTCSNVNKLSNIVILFRIFLYFQGTTKIESWTNFLLLFTGDVVNVLRCFEEFLQFAIF
jgi:hypothetical protein